MPHEGDTASLAGRFLVARNPDQDSTLPFLLRVPVGKGLVLKARDRWPRASRVHCHRAEEWPAQPEILEDVRVLECRRRGIAIDMSSTGHARTEASSS